jgi:hypothetical protein
LALFAARRAEAPRLLAALMLAAYAAFYLRVDPLMNIHGRFLFPAAPFLFELARPAFVWAHERWLGLRRLPLLRLVAVPVAFVVAVLPQPEEDLQAVKRALRKEWAIAPEPTLTRARPLGHIRRSAWRSARIPGIERLTIASVDAGVLAYCSRARTSTWPGLNDRVIAAERDPRRLADYVFGRQPDLLFQRERTDGTLITYGHGPLGDHRTWASHPGWDGYEYAGSITGRRALAARAPRVRAPRVASGRGAAGAGAHPPGGPRARGAAVHVRQRALTAAAAGVSCGRHQPVGQVGEVRPAQIVAHGGPGAGRSPRSRRPPPSRRRRGAPSGSRC